jgi:hypothetical protein
MSAAAASPEVRCRAFRYAVKNPRPRGRGFFVRGPAGETASRNAVTRRTIVIADFLTCSTSPSLRLCGEAARAGEAARGRAARTDTDCRRTVFTIGLHERCATEKKSAVQYPENR